MHLNIYRVALRLAPVWLMLRLCSSIVLPKNDSGCTYDNGNPEPSTVCMGLDITWVEMPNSTVYSDQEFSVRYKLTMTRVTSKQLFYDQLLQSPHFDQFNGSDQISWFCEEHGCPEDVYLVTSDTCCVHHTGLHVCTGENFQCGANLNDQGIGQRWGNIDDVFHSTLTMFSPGVHYLLVVMTVDNLHIYRRHRINIITPPECGDGICQSNESCNDCSMDCCLLQMVHLIVVIIVSIVIVFLTFSVIIIILCCFYSKHNFYQDTSWVVDFSEIETVLSSATASRSLADVLLSYARHTDTESVKQHTNLQVFTPVGIYKDQDVSIKYVYKATFNVTSAIKKEVYQVRVLDHPNLCKFIGASVEPPNIAILTEYCPKGSLNDVLQNTEIHLNWGFRFSFAGDIVKGMAYLHSRGVFHGQLKSTKCLINNRWVLKISDYGLAELRKSQGAPLDPIKLACEVAFEVYKAPEVLNNSKLAASGPADVYSYAVLLLEIATRIYPFSDVLDDKTYLPDIDKNCPCPLDYVELLQRCWSQIPSNRPTFTMIKGILQDINPNHESPVDNMILMIEKYNNQLELMVAERTQDIVTEKEKSDQLLCAMLPANVVRELKMGNNTTARSFNCATIYFSDIVGFTSLASESTPMQVVNMLNELYTMFDYILDRFDVYKVETIGDAYMVVSGVPNENGINHATEIACMALEMISVVKEFTIPHKNMEKLKIRVGIHCGPVVAGVVGTKMPRYCLFGDTVNIASKMESTGAAMRIHVSDPYARLLKRIGGFDLEKRRLPLGSSPDADPMTTWWLKNVTIAKWAFRLHKHSVASMP